MVLGMSAQINSKKVKTVQLKTGTEFYYSEDKQDSIRIIFTPSGDSLGIKIYVKDNGSIDFLYSQIHHVEFWGDHTEIIPDGTNENKNNANDLKKNAEAWRLEFPRLYQGDELTFEITHSTQDFGITYSLEWDATSRANRWTCYQLHSGNMVKNVKRNDAFKEDPNIPAEYNVSPSEYKGTGYSKGHLCPSGDRLASREQNSQTFYMSNMQPQIQEHNGGVWNTLEGKVRNSWAPSNSQDTLYVVKAATIDPNNIKDYTSSGLIVPKFFYMALLYYSKSSNSYSALGVWSPHEGGSTTEYITIDELERRTGIDFFCNLPDEIEKVVESKIDMNKWR
jgi:endonuclease G